jgi:formylglycine-generating enzyme required for sulfatase activity
MASRQPAALDAALVPTLVSIPGGEFVMGKDGSSRKDEGPAHRVVVAPFRAAVSPVTNAQYVAYVAAADLEPPPFIQEERHGAPELPAVGISWFEAVAYCEWLATQTGIPFRLPSEAEREFAALGGLSGADWPWEGDAHPIADWIDSRDGPHGPREECANGYGLRCMAENVHEWCSDWYDPAYYAVSPADNPRGPASGTRRASRGGSWRHREKVTRVNARSSIPPDFRYADYGFRPYADA